MDRVIVYPGQAPRSLDLLSTNRNAMTAIGMLTGAVLGTSTLIDGLAIAPTAPASLQVQVGQGAIYALSQVDPTAYSSLAADTADLIVKQGLLFGTTQLTVTPPVSSGQSQVFLVQAAFQEVDGGSVLLPYYNASNPAQPWQGPNNGGSSQYTLRLGQCVVGLKAGIPAPTGSQTVPAPDAGYTGLYAITVANGASTVTAANIATLAGAPFVGLKLPAVRNAAGANATSLAASATLVANNAGLVIATALSAAVTLTLPAANALGAGIPVRFRLLRPGTDPGTYSLNILPGGVDLLQPGALNAAAVAIGANPCLLLPGEALEIQSDGVANWYGEYRGQPRQVNYDAAGSRTWYCPPFIVKPFAQVLGAGGGGGGANSTNYGCGGAGGGAAFGPCLTVPGSGYAITVGTGGTSGPGNQSTNGGWGGNGGSTSFASFMSATGGQGGPGNQSNVYNSTPLGGTGTGGQFNAGGANGGVPIGTWATGYTGGSGGGSIFGPGGTAASSQQGQGGQQPGAGGSGASSASGIQQNGGYGADGCVRLKLW